MRLTAARHSGATAGVDHRSDRLQPSAAKRLLPPTVASARGVLVTATKDIQGHENDLSQMLLRNQEHGFGFRNHHRQKSTLQTRRSKPVQALPCFLNVSMCFCFEPTISSHPILPSLGNAPGVRRRSSRRKGRAPPKQKPESSRNECALLSMPVCDSAEHHAGECRTASWTKGVGTSGCGQLKIFRAG